MFPRFLGDAAPAPPGLPALSTSVTRTIDRRDQPYGEDGIRFSLIECAKRAASGRLDIDVRAWTMRRLHEAGNPKGPVARARVLHKAMIGPLKNGRWAPDPTDAEFMPTARDMIATCKGGKTNEDGSCPLGEVPPFFALGDCDDLSLTLGASLLSSLMLLATTGNAGVYGAIVGHAYTREKMIEHVLCAIWGEGQWWYCDPSMTSLKFGECKPYTRERAIYVPSLDLACDADVCLAPGGAASNGPPIPVRGDFVGLSLGEELQFPPDARGFRYVATDRGVGLGRAIDLTATELDARLFAGSR